MQQTAQVPSPMSICQVLPRAMTELLPCERTVRGRGRGRGGGVGGGWHSSLGGVGTSFTGLRSLAAEASGEGEVGGGAGGAGQPPGRPGPTRAPGSAGGPGSRGLV